MAAPGAPGEFDLVFTVCELDRNFVVRPHYEDCVFVGCSGAGVLVHD